MRVLITNIAMKGRSGTETATRDIALGLLAAGEDPVVYSPMLGDIAKELIRAGVPVVDDLAAVTQPPDIIHGHHYVETYRALARFPETRAIFVSHDSRAWHDIPPVAPQILRQVAVDLNCRERLVTRYGIPEEKVRVICNSFDPEYFPQRKIFSEKPLRALVFSNYAGPNTYLRYIQEACAELKIRLDVIGLAMGKQHADPGKILHKYDLVFGIARCAIEALASGAAVILCGVAGLGPMVDPANVQNLRAWNFGRRMLLAPHDKDLIIAEIRKYNREATIAVNRYMVENASLPGMIAQYRALYREVTAELLPKKIDLFSHALAHTAQYAAKFEGLTTALYEGKYCMLLPSNIGRQLELKIVECPRTAATPFHAKVLFTNRSREQIASCPPYPVYLSYHWISANGEVAVFEGRRTALEHRITPGENEFCHVAVDLPEKSGNYRLRITLVQEGVVWLDHLNPPLLAETEVEVRLAG